MKGRAESTTTMKSNTFHPLLKKRYHPLPPAARRSSISTQKSTEATASSTKDAPSHAGQDKPTPTFTADSTINTATTHSKAALEINVENLLFICLKLTRCSPIDKRIIPDFCQLSYARLSLHPMRRWPPNSTICTLYVVLCTFPLRVRRSG